MTEEKHLGMTEVFVGALEPLFRTRGNGGVSFVEGVSARSGCSEQRKSSVPAQ